ncbi:MAG: hypothetical protein GX270_04005 [Clostridiaceae bacterium]|nr:hypothetical protein [Clostridiaceae bacterium]
MSTKKIENIFKESKYSLAINEVLDDLFPDTQDKKKKGGIGGGDVKLSGALGIWFGFPNIMYVLLIGSILAFIYGSYNLIRKGKWKKKMQPFFTSVMIKLLYDRAGKIYTEKLPEEGIAEDGVPFGTFLIIGGWIYFISQII